MHTITTTIYTFEELSDRAKETAREWFRTEALCYEWWDSTYEDAAAIGLKITAFDVDRYAKGEFTQATKSVARAIRKNHGPTCETYKDAVVFLAASRNVNDVDAQEALDAEFLKTILEDYRIMLRTEEEYLLSDEQVDESIQTNEYEFLKNGQRA